MSSRGTHERVAYPTIPALIVAEDLQAIAKRVRRRQYATVFARHAYQGGWSRTGTVKCRCGWNAPITTTSEDKRTIARESFDLWACHLAEVVVR